MEGHFSYKKLFHGNTLMIVIPHEDDEINAAGSVICGACREGMEVVCVFITNGDYKYLPQVRIGEAIRSLAVLGVPKKTFYFWGILTAVSIRNAVYMSECSLLMCMVGQKRQGQKDTRNFVRPEPENITCLHGKIC